MSRWYILLVVLAACLSVRVTSAGVPSPANSTVPACMAVCPLGDMTFTVVVRDLANNPLNGASVVLDFSGCAGVLLCPQNPTDPYLLNPAARTARMFTDINGSVTFPLRAGGGCAGNAMNVFANGTLLAQRNVASPDQNGNGMAVAIIDIDDVLFAAKLGTSDPTADFDCDGDVDAADQLIFGRHLAHTCNGIVLPVHRGTWGSLKLHYR